MKIFILQAFNETQMISCYCKRKIIGNRMREKCKVEIRKKNFSEFFCKNNFWGIKIIFQEESHQLNSAKSPSSFLLASFHVRLQTLLLNFLPNFCARFRYSHPRIT